MAGVLGRALSRGVLADVRPAGVLSGYDPFGAAALSGYGIDPFEVQQRNLVDDATYRFQPQGQMARLGQIARDAAQGSRDTRAALDAKWALMGYPDSMRRQIDRAGNPNNIGRFARDQYEGFVSDVQSAGDWNERGDNNWVSDLGDYGMLAMGFIPGARSTRKVRAFHGTPHDFDRFDLSRIGTGEGNQTFGHGLYFAENEATARSYRDTVSPRIHSQNLSKWIRENAEPVFGRPISESVMTDLFRLRSIHTDPAEVAKLLFMRNPEIRDIPRDRLTEIVQQVPGPPQGKMYEVEIDADPDQFLDWDTPLGDQSQSVREVINGNWGGIPEVQPHRTGSQIYTGIGFDAAHRGDVAGRYAPRYVAERLRDAGIPGVRYLDQLSRRPGNSMTRNFVVFDDKLINILRKYAIPGVLGGSVLGAGILSQPQQAQAAQ